MVSQHLDLRLNRSFRTHTHGPQKGMTVVEHWYTHDPLTRYRVCFSTKAWGSMNVAIRQGFEFRMRVDAGEALTERKIQEIEDERD